MVASAHPQLLAGAGEGDSVPSPALGKDVVSSVLTEAGRFLANYTSWQSAKVTVALVRPDGKPLDARVRVENGSGRLCPFPECPWEFKCDGGGFRSFLSGRLGFFGVCCWAEFSQLSFWV